MSHFRTTLPFLLSALLLPAFGCGVKGNPIPYVTAYPDSTVQPTKAETPKSEPPKYHTPRSEPGTSSPNASTEGKR